MFSRKFNISIIALLFGFGYLSAQSIDVKAGDETIKITPMGRFYFDGLAFMKKDKTYTSNGVALTDLRLGLKAKYKMFEMKIDLGFSGGKIGYKDIFLQYNLHKTSYVRAGYFAEPFGIDHMESSANIKFITPSASSYAFSPGRKVGLEYIGWNKYMWLGAGVFADSDAMSNSIEGNQGYATSARVVVNPIQEPGKIFHIGIAGSYRKADRNGFDADGNKKPRNITFSSPLMTNVDKRKFLNANITNADYQAKYAVELIGALGPAFIQAEYFHANVKRKDDLPSYMASGAYAQMGFLAIGGDYTYSAAWARLDKPKPKSLEFAIRYNYTDLNDKHADIYGGRISDWTLAGNYYLNKYMMFRVDYSIASLGNKNPIAAGQTIGLLQAKLQVVF